MGLARINAWTLGSRRALSDPGEAACPPLQPTGGAAGCERIRKDPLRRSRLSGRWTFSWDELSKQFAKVLEAFARANYDRMLRQREQRRPK